MAFAQLIYRESLRDIEACLLAQAAKLYHMGFRAFFVTRAESNMKWHRVYSIPTDRATGIICDQRIALDGFYTRQDYPAQLRRVRFNDPDTGKTLIFLTNPCSKPFQPASTSFQRVCRATN